MFKNKTPLSKGRNPIFLSGLALNEPDVVTMGLGQSLNRRGSSLAQGGFSVFNIDLGNQ